MEESSLIGALLKIQYKINDAETPKNEKLFLLSVGFSSHYLIFNNNINLFYDYYDRIYNSIIGSYIKNNVKYLIEIYNILGENIFIGKIFSDIVDGKFKNFDYVKDALKMFYSDHLTDNEKSHSIGLLNELPENFLRKSMDIGDIRANIEELLDFFILMNRITNKMFRYNEKVAYDLLSTNNYTLHKVFFNSLKNIVININQTNRFGIEEETRLAFINNIENLLSEVSEDFNASMAKSLIK